MELTEFLVLSHWGSESFASHSNLSWGVERSFQAVVLTEFVQDLRRTFSVPPGVVSLAEIGCSVEVQNVETLCVTSDKSRLDRNWPCACCRICPPSPLSFLRSDRPVPPNPNRKPGRGVVIRVGTMPPPHNT